MRLLSLLLLLIASPALAQIQPKGPDWRNYDYPAMGFGVHFPAEPAVVRGTYPTAGGGSVPASIYSVKLDNVEYRMTVADFSAAKTDEKTAIDGAVKTWGTDGREIKLDVEARINRRYGRELSVGGKDGSYAMVAIFFFNDRLYELAGKALPPNATIATGKTIRFQQSLQFLD
ncbi:MAG: hypothetical protein ABIO39_02270 [Caulobacteraceae bacterium]